MSDNRWPEQERSHQTEREYNRRESEKPGQIVTLSWEEFWHAHQDEKSPDQCWNEWHVIENDGVIEKETEKKQTERHPQEASSPPIWLSEHPLFHRFAHRVALLPEGTKFIRCDYFRRTSA